jgi:hypothetical protein
MRRTRTGGCTGMSSTFRTPVDRAQRTRWRRSGVARRADRSGDDAAVDLSRERVDRPGTEGRVLVKSGPHGRGVDEVLSDEPHLELVAAQYVTHEQVVGPVVAVGGRAGDRVPSLGDDDLVGLEEA